MGRKNIPKKHLRKLGVKQTRKYQKIKETRFLKHCKQIVRQSGNKN
jgi:hypothetical protein